MVFSAASLGRSVSAWRGAAAVGEDPIDEGAGVFLAELEMHDEPAGDVSLDGDASHRLLTHWLFDEEPSGPGQFEHDGDGLAVEDELSGSVAVGYGSASVTLLRICVARSLGRAGTAVLARIR